MNNDNHTDCHNLHPISAQAHKHRVDQLKSPRIRESSVLPTADFMEDFLDQQITVLHTVLPIANRHTQWRLKDFYNGGSPSNDRILGFKWMNRVQILFNNKISKTIA